MLNGYSPRGKSCKLHHEPFFLLCNSKVRVIEQKGIVCLTQGSYFAVRVDVVAFLHIFKNVVVACLLPFRFKFIVATLGTHFSRCSNKNFKFSIRKNHSAYVATIHNDAFVTSHALLLCRHGLAHKGEGGNRANVWTHLHAANLLFYAFTIKVHQGEFCFRVEFKVHHHVFHHAF